MYFTDVKLDFEARERFCHICLCSDKRIKSCDKTTAGVYEVNEGQRRRRRHSAPLCALAWLCGFTLPDYGSRGEYMRFRTQRPLTD